MRSTVFRNIFCAVATSVIVAAACTPLPENYPLPPDRALVAGPDSTLAHGVVLATGDTAYWDYQVTTRAAAFQVIEPQYFEGTRVRGAEGKVVARFAVDTLGVPMMRTFVVVSSPDYELSEAVASAVAKSRFRPAELHGRLVVQIVEMPFNFSLQK